MTEPVQTEWFQPGAGFFGPEYLRIYDALGCFDSTHAEVAFISRQLRRYDLLGRSDVLDLCCGHGRHLAPLAMDGWKMTGFDINPLFLDLAREGCKELDVEEPRFVEGDSRELPFENGEFHAVLNLFTAFGYFANDRQHQQMLDEVGRVLRPGGVFVIETMNRDWIMRNFQPAGVEHVEGGMVVHEREFDYVRSGIFERRTIIPSLSPPDSSCDTSSPTEVTTWVRLFTLCELVAMCDRAGLEFQCTFGDMDESVPYSMSTRRLVAIFVKRPA